MRKLEYELDFVTNRAARDTQVICAAFVWHSSCIVSVATAMALAQCYSTVGLSKEWAAACQTSCLTDQIMEHWHCLERPHGPGGLARLQVRDDDPLQGSLVKLSGKPFPFCVYDGKGYKHSHSNQTAGSKL